MSISRLLRASSISRVNRPFTPEGSLMNDDMFLSPDVAIGTVIISASGHDDFIVSEIILT